ncbi:MAG: AMP-binding protein [Acidimicrobiia bacterium]
MTQYPPSFGPDALTPLAYLERARYIYADSLAVVDGDLRLTYGEFADRCARLAGGLVAAGIEPGDRVSVLSSNTHMALEAHYGVPMAGGVLNALNTRLSAPELAYIVEHAGSKLLIVDHELRALGQQTLALMSAPPRLVVADGPDDEYASLLTAEPHERRVDDEWSLISINYTSGTTGRPKGVMYSHRGARVSSMATVAHCKLDARMNFLWTLPMFHCNGWCYTWAVTAAGGTHVCLRKVEPAEIWRAIHEDGVTHFNAAPTVLIGVGYHADAAPAPNAISVATGGAPPSPTLIARLAELNIDVTHLYGLTETYGPSVLCEWRPQWDSLDAAGKARMKARQGVHMISGTRVRVVDDTGADVAADGNTPGEVVLRGDNVMTGYYRDPEATEKASIPGPGGAWFRSGDVGVMHPDGYIELRDRSKDVIISGGENITSIEVEQAIASHAAVLECAVVSAPDDKWGEVPVAFVVLKPGTTASEADIVEHVKASIARYKAPKRVYFEELPKTGTGKIQKFVLRDRMWNDRSARIG